MRYRTIALVLCLGISCPPASAAAQAATTPAAVAGPFWFAPVLDFAKFLITTFHHVSDKQKPDFEAKISAMENDAKALEPVPTLLVQSADFREKAIAFSWFVQTGANKTAYADVLWQRADAQVNELNGLFNRFENSPTITALETQDTSVLDKIKAGHRAIDTLKNTLQMDTSTADAKRNAFQAMVQSAKDVVVASDVPEDHTIRSTRALLGEYNALIADAKQKAGVAHASFAPPREQDFFSPRLLAVAYQESERRPKPAVAEEKDGGATAVVLDAAAAPAWIQDLAEANATRPGIDWRNTAASFGAGILVGILAAFVFNTFVGPKLLSGGTGETTTAAGT